MRRPSDITPAADDELQFLLDLMGWQHGESDVAAEAAEQMMKERAAGLRRRRAKDIRFRRAQKALRAGRPNRVRDLEHFLRRVYRKHGGASGGPSALRDMGDMAHRFRYGKFAGQSLGDLVKTGEGRRYVDFMSRKTPRVGGAIGEALRRLGPAVRAGKFGPLMILMAAMAVMGGGDGEADRN